MPLTGKLGPNVPVAAIQYHLVVIRKEGAALGLAESKPSLSSPSKASTPKNGDRAGVVSSGKAKAKRRGRGGMLSDDARYAVERATCRSNTDTLVAMMRP